MADYFQNPLEGSEEMTKFEIFLLIDYLKKENWTPEKILDLLEYISR